jgi:AcrR family transcriptional regulator
MRAEGALRVRKPAGFGRQNQLGQAMGAKGLQTRRRLLAAIEELLRTMPLRDLRVAHIVRVAQTSTATFYVYFNDVPEAVLALISEITQSPPSLLRFFREPWTEETSVDNAYQFVTDYIEHWQAHAPLFRVRNLAADEGDARFSEARVGAVVPLVDAMAARVAERQAAGELRPDLQANSAVGALLALVERIGAIRQPDPGGLNVTRPKLMRVAAFFTLMLFGRGHDVLWSVASETPAGKGKNAAAKPELLSESIGEAVAVVAAPEARLNHQGQTMGAKGARTRLRLMEATGELLRSQPLRDLSVADIAKRANTSTSTFYLYFADTSAAVLAVIGQVTQSTPELQALALRSWEGDCQEARALQFVQAYIERCRAYEPLFRVRNLAADEGDRQCDLLRFESARPLLMLIAARVAERRASGALPADIDPVSAAGAVLAMIERIAVTPNIAQRGVVTLDTIVRAASLFFTTLTGGQPGAWTVRAKE